MIFHQLEVRIIDRDIGRDVDPKRLAVRIVTLPGSGKGSPLPPWGWRTRKLRPDPALGVFFVDGAPFGSYRLEVRLDGRLAWRRRVELWNAPQKEVVGLRREAPPVPGDEPLAFGVLLSPGEAEPPAAADIAGLRRLQREPFAGRRFVLYSTLFPVRTEALAALAARTPAATSGLYVGSTHGAGTLLTRRLYLEAAAGTPPATVARLVSKHGLHSLERLPVGADLYLAEARPEVLDVRALASQLERHKAIEFAEPVTKDELEVHAPDFDPSWDRHAVGLAPPPGGRLRRSGDPVPRVAVIDRGYLPVEALRAHPEFAAAARDPGIELESYAVGDDCESPASHGLMCAARVAGLSVGAVPGSHVMVVSDPSDDRKHLQAWLWAAGLEEGPGGRPRRTGADVISCSLYRRGGLSRASAAMLRRLVVEGRSGRGCVAFFSAGNEGQDIHLRDSYGGSPYTICVAASSRLDAETEIFACYSGVGDVDLCAPSGAVKGSIDEGGPFDQVAGADHAHLGTYPARPLAATTVEHQEDPKTVEVVNASGFAPRCNVVLLWPDGGWALRPVRGVERTRLHFAVGLTRAALRGTVVISGSRWLGFLAQEAHPDDTVLVVDREFDPGNARSIVVTSSTGNEPVEYRLEDVRGAEIRVRGPLRPHGVGSQVLLDETHACLTGGTSTATPVCAGVAARVLQVDPTLTWVEVRQVLRDTAAPIDPGCSDQVGQWLDRSGRAGASPGYFSRRYGFGRVDAAAAIAEAARYRGRHDLWIRRSGTDEGARTLDRQEDSPDLWVRSVDPRYLGAGERQDPSRHEGLRPDRHHWVCALVRNRGTHRSLQAWVRFHVAPEQGSPYRFPDDFERRRRPPDATDSDRESSQFLGELTFQDVPAGGSIVVYLFWPKHRLPSLLDPDGKPRRLHLLVAVSPLDGPLDGLTVLDCNNLAQRNLAIDAT